MGKLAILIVLGLGLAFGFIGYTVNRANVDRVENISGYFKYSVARNIAHTAVNLALYQLEKGDTTSFRTSVMDGACRVNMIFTNDTLNLVSRGEFMDTSYTMDLTLRRIAKPFPEIESAVTINIQNVEFISKGSGSIDGRDHDLNGNINGPGLPGVTVPSPVESTSVANYGTSVIGNPVKIKTSSTMPDASQYVNEYIYNADYRYTSGTHTSVTWGSENDPKIIYCDGTARGGVKFAGNVQGWGILVVKGKLSLRGNFIFRGLVLVYEDVKVHKQLETGAGTPDVLGAIVAVGPPTSKFELKGNPKFAYSSQALKKAQLMLRLRAYRILRWYE